MKTFDEMLPTATAEMREFVEAYESAYEAWRESSQEKSPPIVVMRDLPPAKEPVSVEGTCEGYEHIVAPSRDDVVKMFIGVLHGEGAEAGIRKGDRVRVVKIEENR